MAFAEHLTSPAFKLNAKEALVDPQGHYEVEQRLIPALEKLRSGSPWELLSYAVRGLSGGSDCKTCLERMGLAAPKNFTSQLYASLLRGALP